MSIIYGRDGEIEVKELANAIKCPECESENVKIEVSEHGPGYIDREGYVIYETYKMLFCQSCGFKEEKIYSPPNIESLAKRRLNDD